MNVSPSPGRRLFGVAFARENARCPLREGLAGAGKRLEC